MQIRTLTFLFALLLVLCPTALAQQRPTQIILGGLFPLTGTLGPGGVQREAAARVAIQAVNNDTTILPDIELVMETFNTNTTQAQGLAAFFNALDIGAVAMIGEASSAVSQIIAIAGGVFNSSQISYSSTAQALSNKFDYPYFSRMVPPDNKQGEALYSIIEYYQWQPYVAAISTADTYGVGGVNAFIQAGNLSLLTYQQFYSGTKDISLQMTELVNSKARVFLAFMLSGDAITVFSNAPVYELVGPTYVWLCSDGCAQSSVFTYSNGSVNATIRDAMRGMLGTTPQGGVGPKYQSFLDLWQTLNPAEYPGAGKRSINTFAPHAYDCVYTYAYTFHEIYYNASTPGPFNLSVQNIANTLRELRFVGLTGDIAFEANGDRKAIYQILNLRDNNTFFSSIGTWSDLNVTLDVNDTVVVENGLVFINATQFYDGTENVPDLDVQPPFDYWSCYDKKEKTDPTGKTVKLEKPGGNDPNNIKDYYICDQWIDCDNMSDEGLDCSPSYVAVFIAFGIITGLLILTLPVFAAFVIIFGFVMRLRRFMKLSPIFLLVILFAAFVGYCSTFAWYGKPEVVACNFQSWLLGLSINLMISALFAKSFRIWRIFKSPLKRTRITDNQLMILIGILMIPAFIILIIWTIVSTPTAHLTEVDGHKHYVCDTGGFTGPPGGYVFFGIFVGYTAVVLLFGAFLAFVTRNVSDEFSESRLVGYSVYNLVFLAAVVIPVFFVLRTSNPVAAWIIRTLAILYGFTATVWLQFLPQIAFVIFKDRCKEPNANFVTATSIETQTGSASTA